MPGFSTKILHNVIKRDITGLYMWKEKGCFAFFAESTIQNPQNKTKKFNMDASIRYKRKTVEEHARSAQHTASVECELLSRVSTFQIEIDRREKV